MRRREFVVAFAGAAIGWSPVLAEVEIPRIGFVQPGSREENQGLLDAFRDGLSKLGWNDGSNIAILDRWAEDRTETLPGIVKELIGSGPAVLVTGGSPATLAATRASATMPIVFVGVDDPVSVGVVDALGQPGRNATGLSLTSSEVITERLQLLREFVPSLHRLGVIVRDDPGLDQKLLDIRSEAGRMGIAPLMLEATTGKALELAFARMRGARCEAVYVASGPLGPAKRARIIALAAESRLPAIYSFRVFPAEGGLMSFGADYHDLFRRAAGFVDKILKGAKPADMPVEPPHKFDLSVNRKTAKALGLTIPPPVRRRGDWMRRRELLVLVGSAAASSRSVRAQQRAMPVIGFLGSTSPGPYAPFVAAFRQGLSETGWVEGQNLAIEYRWAEGRYDRLPALAADLVGRKVDVIAASGGNVSALAAKNATSTIPIVFASGGDPVGEGLVASLARPGGNVTGVTFMIAELTPKRLELLSDLVPQARVIALLANPNSPGTERMIQDAQEAARVKGLRLDILKAGTESEIDAAFATLVQLHAAALVVGADPFFFSRRDQLVALAARHAVPAIYQGREFVATGGLITYGTSLTTVYRLVGTYAGKILNGANPADLPVEQPTTFELVVNLNTAKALGLTVPPSILARATEVIE